MCIRDRFTVAQSCQFLNNLQRIHQLQRISFFNLHLLCILVVYRCNFPPTDEKNAPNPPPPLWDDALGVVIGSLLSSSIVARPVTGWLAIAELTRLNVGIEDGGERSVGFLVVFPFLVFPIISTVLLFMSSILQMSRRSLPLKFA
eukprot:TRINITY_DN4982_c0_g1_i4.p1 TRINITY_DN4982_c0_g1~~TRINITY_DN4982_c0_g1_i4.p1  ORF type:complete len:145 (+),score=17.51 TRINITY_DN4982_c0_g1_i4:144-578(+)